MIRQIDIDQGAARRTAALMGMVIILALAIFGVIVLRGLQQTTYPLPIAGNHQAAIR